MSANKSSSVSLVWEFFTVCTVCNDPTKAKCKCKAVYARGKTPKTYSTKSLLDHFKKNMHMNMTNSKKKQLRQQHLQVLQLVVISWI